MIWNNISILEKRKAEAEKIRKKYDDRIPVIVERAKVYISLDDGLVLSFVPVSLLVCKSITITFFSDTNRIILD